jgi:hypothetical protein
MPRTFGTSLIDQAEWLLGLREIINEQNIISIVHNRNQFGHN